MPTLQTPPDGSPTTPPRLSSSRYGALEQHELIHLLDEVNDERARARFREAVYISVIVWIAIGWFIFYGPQVLFHQPRLINPADVLRQRDHELTYLDLPKDLAKLPNRPTNTLSDQNRRQQTTHPSLDQKTLQQLQAMRRAGSPGGPTAPALKPQPRAAQPEAPTPQPQQQPPAQQAQQTPLPEPRPQPAPQQQATVESPRPAPTRPNFATGAQTAGDAIRQAARNAATPGQGGNYGANIPVEHQGLNTGVDVLSDTMGVDFNPYLRRILREIYNTWIPLIPEEARPPLNKQGVTLIRFSILANGQIGAMHLEDSSHDDAINRAAWGSITGVGQFPPLPAEFHGPNLELRIHYLVNKDPNAQ